ncbi:MAG: nicotinate (nicotinamide) nucleotide adenylyltransferase [Treponema sp.]|nr:nicotinate (nicotinamide) nucleotide adenylyltransferase [Treponema sp.]
MKLAILGGSFNPVHLGHLYLAESALKMGYDRLVLVPAYSSPFKPGVRDAAPQDRLDMLAASAPADPRFAVDDCEIRREGVSYTIDTIADIMGRYCPEGKPGLILGDDLAEGFTGWRDYGKIIALTDIIIARRLSSKPVFFPYPYRQLDNAILDISSRDIRSRIRGGESWRYLMPEGARFIIEDRGLYGYKTDGADRTESAGQAGGARKNPAPRAKSAAKAEIARIEGAVRSLVSPSRFLHSRAVAALAWELCARFGQDPDRGYLAGIAHDIAKSMGENDLKRFAKKDGKPLSALERKKPSLLHARAGAALLREYFGITDGEVLAAVRDHTAGSSSMGPLEKIVYIADKIEPTRRNGQHQPYRGGADQGGAGASGESLDSLFASVVKDTVAYLRSRKLDLSEDTRGLLETMEKKGGA